jgi:hypothetical protein
MAFTEDLSAFFDDDEFAVTATLNGTASGNVIVDKEYLRAVGMVASSNPVALAIASEYPAAALNGTLAAGGASYVIRDREPQDDGAIVLLQLESV